MGPMTLAEQFSVGLCATSRHLAVLTWLSLELHGGHLRCMMPFHHPLAVIVSSSPSTWTPRNGRSLSRVGRSRSDRCYGPNNKYGFCRSICAQD
ncbi:uncharacterized protein LOC143766062 isoform X2 [Ranitomeya variabilis]|uniref:uncharacterized protein LOC143766062 isoform X2 n=1 Tax=Ranitomeya variabilis TaxID=490064 RepID=UPI004056AF2F